MDRILDQYIVLFHSADNAESYRFPSFILYCSVLCTAYPIILPKLEYDSKLILLSIVYFEGKQDYPHLFFSILYYSFSFTLFFTEYYTFLSYSILYYALYSYFYQIPILSFLIPYIWQLFPFLFWSILNLSWFNSSDFLLFCSIPILMTLKFIQSGESIKKSISWKG